MDSCHVLQSIPGFADAQVIRKLAQGITGRTFLVRRAMQDYVLLLRSDEAALFVADGFAEHEFACAAYAAGLAPEPIFCSADRQVLLRRFSSGQVWSESLLTADRLGTLARLLGRLHQIPVEPVSHDWAEEVLLRYADKAAQPASPMVAAGVRALEVICGYPASSALCHGDLVCGNIIEQDAALQLIDWEYARIADPYFDLAVFLVHHELEPAVAQTLLDTYAGVAGGLIQGRLEGWLSYYQALQTLWLLALQKQGLISSVQQVRLRKRVLL